MMPLRAFLAGAIILIFIICAAFSVPVEALQLTQMSAQPTGQDGQEVVVLRFSEPVTSRAFLLPEPPRMVIDLPPFQWRVALDDLKHYNGRLIKNIRYARFDTKTSRVVLDLTQPITFRTIGREEGDIRPAVEFSYYLYPTQWRNRQGAAVESAYPPLRRSRVTEWRKEPLATAGQTVQGITPQDMTQQLTKRPMVIVPPAKMEELVAGRYGAMPDRSSSFAVAPVPQQKPHKPLIVIDAGHGGQDPGTIGRSKTHEKMVTLSYAKALKEALVRGGRYRVELTREDDRFILLRERFAIARRMDANLFISLHADSAPNIKARGLSIYTVSEEASDAEAAALAAQENKADTLADMDLRQQDQQVADILIDLAQRDTKNKSIVMADLIVRAMQQQGVTMLPNPHRYAGFAVLKAPDIPSALVELGFLSNPQEEKVIQTKQHRERIVRGLVEGITNYFAEQRSHE